MRGTMKPFNFNFKSCHLCEVQSFTEHRPPYLCKTEDEKWPWSLAIELYMHTYSIKALLF